MSKHSKRQEAQKRREHQLGHEYGGNRLPCFGELQQISKNAPLRNRLQMCLGSYDDAQKTMNAFGLKSVVGTETVPTTPGVDTKHDLFSSSKTLEHSQSHSGINKKHVSSSSKLSTVSMRPSKHEMSGSSQSTSGYQRPPQRPPKSSVSPRVNPQLPTANTSLPPDNVRQVSPSPISSKQYVKPVTPRPPSRQDNRPKEKREKEKVHHRHHHVGKEKRPDKERIKLQQEKAHQKPPKLLTKPPAVKNEHSSSYEDTQVKHVEPNNINKTLGSGRPLMPSMPPSKSPHNRGKESNIALTSSSAVVTAKPVPSKVPKPLPSPTMRTSFASEFVSDSHRSPTKEKVDRNATINTSLEVSMTSEKKVKEKKLKKKKHKSKSSELKESERLPPAEDITEYAIEPKPQPRIPNKKPVAQKPTSLDLSSSNSPISSSITIKQPAKLTSPLLSPMEDVSQDTYLQKIFDEMAGPTSPILPIQTPCKNSSFSFGFAHTRETKNEVETPFTTEAVLIGQQEVKHEVKQESWETDYWNPNRFSEEADVASVKRNPFMEDVKQELMHGVLLADDAAAHGGYLDDHDGSSSDSSSSSDSDSEGELLLSAKSDFPDMDSIEDINFDDVPIDTITPLRSNPSSFSFIMEPDSHAQLEPPVHSVEPMSHFVMAPQLGAHIDTKNESINTDSNSSGSEDGESSSDEESSDSDMEAVEDLFVPPATTTVDQTRNLLLVTPNATHHTETTTTFNTSSVTVTPSAVANRPPTSMKRLRNMFAAVKQPETTTSSGGTAHVNATPVPPLYAEAVTPVTTVAAISDPKPLTSMDVNRQQPLQATVSATTTITSEATNSLQLPRRGNTKRMTSVSSKHSNNKSLLSEESSSESEGEESGEVTNSDSEEDTKPKPTKQAKWDNSLTPAATPETNKLQLLCSIPKEYMRTVHTPVSTPKSPPTARIRPIMVAPEKKFRDRSESASEEHTGRNAYSQQPRDSLYSHRRSHSREDSHEPDYPPRSRDHTRPHRRHSRSMRSSSPDHHHHHSSSRHREPPSMRSSSHWSHGGWSSSTEHHYTYDYDYSSTASSHHYSRRGRHSGRLGKPEMLMEDARKLKHNGDRTSSEVEKAHYYLDAALTYMTYCVSKEEEGDPDKEVMSTTIRLLKHIVHSPGLNILSRDVYCEMLSALCLRSQSVLSMKLFNTLANNESISRNQKILSEYFNTKNTSQGRRSPFVGASPSYSPANATNTTVSCSGGTGGILDYTNPSSCHSPSATVSIPSHIYNMAAAQFSATSHLFSSQEGWRHANNISEQHRDFFDMLDRRAGPISPYSSMMSAVDWAREGLRLLKDTRRSGSCRDY